VRMRWLEGIVASGSGEHVAGMWTVAAPMIGTSPRDRYFIAARRVPPLPTTQCLARGLFRI